MSEEYKSESWLRGKYVDERLSMEEIAGLVDRDETTIRYWMDKFGIDRRELGWQYEGTPWRDESWLREKYLEEGLSTREVADLADTDSGTITRWLDRLDIPTRPKGRHRSVQMAVRTKTESTAHEYIQHREPDGSVSKVLVHRLAGVAWFGFDEVAGNVVHHADPAGEGRPGIPWDTREDVIEPMSRPDHGKHHARNQAWMGSPANYPADLGERVV